MADDTLSVFGDDDFEREVLQSDRPVLVEFWASWCAPCKAILPALTQLAERYAASAKIGKLNTDDHRQIATQFGIRSVPTLLFFKNGQVAEQIVGAVPLAKIEAALRKLL